MNCKFNSTIIDSEEGRNFIIKVVDFFVNTVIEETEHKMSIASEREKELAIRYYKNYKFIRDSIDINKSPKDFYYVLVRKAAKYIYFIEDGMNPIYEFPLNILDRFELTSWFEGKFGRYSTYEIIIMLANKLFNSIYRDLFV